ncbi:Enoyl-CoA hydratase/carnithine racemase [Gordonia sp. KTR9]|nr:Enoyl-CoA hydratase/carnithine racemase [Gordonia sp. KTR9]
MRVEVANNVAVVTMTRPQARNALNYAMSSDMAAAFDDLVARSDVSAIVLAAEGPVFSAGMDLKAFARGEKPSIPGRGLAGYTECGLEKPLIAAIDGPALAGGFELALAADMIVASESSSFGLPEVSRGLIAAGGGLLRLSRSVPYGAVMEIALTGERIDAQRAHDLGIVTRLCPSGEAAQAATELAASIARNAPLALRLTKKIVNETVGWVDSDTYAKHRDMATAVFASEDAKEGAAAFAERRTPVWRGV